MKPSFIFFCIVLVLGFVAGFYYHEGLNEKVQYERDQCYEQLSTTNPYILTDIRTKEIDSMMNDSDCIYVVNTFDQTTGKTKHVCYLKPAS